MKIFKTNQNNPERVLRFIISALLIPAPLVIEKNAYPYTLCFVGLILFFNAVVGTCYIYRILGVNTCKN